MENCIFCSVIKSNTPHHEIIWEDEKHLAFLDLHPFRDGHTLVIPKKHAEHILDLSQYEYGELMEAARAVSIKLKHAIPCYLVSIIVEGQSVDHVHVHVIPLQKGEEIGSSKPDVPKTAEELAQIATRIREK